MAHNNDPMASVQMERYQGNPPRSSPLKSILHDIFTLRQSHSALEARVISIQCDANRPHEPQGEPLFVVKTRSRSEVEGSRLFGRIGNIPLDFRVF